VTRDIRFSVLGPVRASRQGTELDLGHPQQRAVLAALLLREGSQVTVEQLTDDLWGQDVPRTAVPSLRNYIYRLRQILGDADAGLIRSLGTGYAVATGPETLDLAMFEHCLARARASRQAGGLAAAEESYAQGLALWNGTALADAPGPYAGTQRTRLGEMRLLAVEERLACAVELGRCAQAASELYALVTEHPLRERLRELQMLALYGAGRQAEALAVYARTRRLLNAELGVEPGPGLQKTHRRILAADPALNSLTTAATSVPAEAAAPATTTARAPAPAQLPADLLRFTGRKDELNQVEASVPDGDGRAAAATSVIHGMAGIGKTALALHAAHRLISRFPDGQLYVNLRGFDPAATAFDPADALAEFLEALGTRARDIPASLSARSAKYRSVLAGRRVLVLLDNARDAEQVRPLLPGTPGCLALVTSRNQLFGLAVSHQARAIALGQFDARESGEFLASALGAARTEAQPDATDSIIESCAGLPLALAIVAARAAHSPELPLDIVARQLHASRGGLEAFTLDADPAANARSVFSWSYKALSPRAARLFRLLALHPGPDFTAQAAAALTAQPTDQARPLIEELANASLLIEHTHARHTWHDLLRAHAAELLHTHDGDEERGHALHRLMDYYTHTAHAASQALAPGRRPLPLADARTGVPREHFGDAQQATDWFTAEYRVILSLLRTATDLYLDDHARHLAWAPENFLHRQDLWQEALTAHASPSTPRAASTTPRSRRAPTGPWRARKPGSASSTRHANTSRPRCGCSATTAARKHVREHTACSAGCSTARASTRTRSRRPAAH
jgi:DNA-binding SARP family transcriptional activator